MAGWSSAKREQVELAFFQFLKRCFVDSKDAGHISLGDNLYDGQVKLIEEIFDALEEDIHRIFVLKSRQLGISTIVRALTIFLLGLHKGLKGALVFDTAPNREQARSELEAMIRALPATLRFPQIRSVNREGMTLENGSQILFKSAGTRKSKSSGTLGRSVGLSLATLSELCSYDNDEGIESFEQSLSDINPDRLYIYESTARGFNKWNDMWEEARADPAHCRCVFLGWWSKAAQKIDRDESDFQRYGLQPPTDKEIAKIKIVRERYAHEVSPEQLAWIRRKMDPTVRVDVDTPSEFEGSTTRIQEQPWTEEEAFQNTGAQFFPSEALTDMSNKFVDRNFKSYMFTCGMEFSRTMIHTAGNKKSTELKVWEEPAQEGVYCFGVDPAFGENEKNDRASIQVGRCYSDGIDQVAEFASPMPTPQQLAWILSALMGWYAGSKADVRYILELNGPGNSVFNELKQLRFQLENGYQPRESSDQGLKNIFRNVRSFIYSRPDGMAAGQNFHFKCLWVEELIPTPSGWTTMGELQPGDAVFSENGEPCSVTWASPVMYGHDCHAITFEDGNEIVADEDHLWPVEGGLLKTAELVAGLHAVGCAKPMVLPAIDLPIDPYVLGVWLGDGSKNTGLISGAAVDLEELRRHIGACGYEIGETGTSRSSDYFTVLGLRVRLRELGVLSNKSIPAAYLRGSFSQRLALLQGLMDTDGSIDKSRQCGFNTTLPHIAKSFEELLRSLGIKPKFFVKYPKLLYRGEIVDCRPCYQFWFTAYEDMLVFRLSRKVSRQKHRPYEGGHGGKGGVRPARSKQLRITDVRPIGSVPVRCVQVDSLSHLYLAGWNMVPTHNTNLQLKVMIMNHLRDYVTTGVYRIKSADMIEEMRSVAQDGDEIKAPSSKKDDRVIAAALMTYHWQQSIRKQLITQNRTREAEAAKRSVTIEDQIGLFRQNMLQNFFQQKQRIRVQQRTEMQRMSWRFR